MAVPQQSSYKPKTIYQSTPLSPNKDTKKPTTSTTGFAASPGGYQSPYSQQQQQRPLMHNNESHDADDRPTELIPIEDDLSGNTTPQATTPSMPFNSKGSIYVTHLQSAPGNSSAHNSGAVSPAMSTTPISYLSPSPRTSDLDPRRTDLLTQDIVKLLESPQRNDPYSTSLQPSSTTTPGSSFVPSTLYVPIKKETTKVSVTMQSSYMSGPTGASYDSSVKVEISDLKPPSSNSQGNSDLNSNSSVKVALSDLHRPTLLRQQTDSALDSPISLDGLLESVEAMGRPLSGSSLTGGYQGPITQQQQHQPSTSVDYTKPLLPAISENETDQKRYSLIDGQSGSSSVARLAPKRPNSGSSSTYPPPPPPPSSGGSHGQADASFSASATLTSSNSFAPTSPNNCFAPPSSTPQAPSTNQPLPLPPPPPQIQRQEDKTPKISFQAPPATHHPPPHQLNHIGGDAMMLFNRPEFAHNPITSMAAFADRPVQKAPSMVRRAKTLKRAAGMTGATPQPEATSQAGPPQPPVKVTQDELYTYLLKLILLAQSDEVQTPTPPAALLVTNKDTHKDLVKALRAKVKDILSGKDQNPVYQDQVVKKALSNMEPKQFKHSTNAEELMLSFSIEMSRIQQTLNIPTNNRDAQISIMVNLL
ncbi:hypothetical protein BGZ65_008085, partial [Modicella reniformis]